MIVQPLTGLLVVGSPGPLGWEPTLVPSSVPFNKVTEHLLWACFLLPLGTCLSLEQCLFLFNRIPLWRTMALYSEGEGGAMAGAEERSDGHWASSLIFRFLRGLVLSSALACLLECCLHWVTLRVPEDEGSAVETLTAPSAPWHLPHQLDMAPGPKQAPGGHVATYLQGTAFKAKQNQNIVILNCTPTRCSVLGGASRMGNQQRSKISA